MLNKYIFAWYIPIPFFLIRGIKQELDIRPTPSGSLNNKETIPECREIKFNLLIHACQDANFIYFLFRKKKMGPEFDSQFEIVPTFSRTCNAQIEGLGWSQTSGGRGGLWQLPSFVI